MSDDFVQAAMDAGKKFLDTPQSARILIIGHFDTDGLCATAMLEQILRRAGYSFESINKQHLNDGIIDELSKNEAEVFVFVDIGANKEKELAALKKEVYILDHHDPQGEAVDGLVHINPHRFGITERNAISGSGVVYFFGLGMDSNNRSLAHLGVLGAIGDTQERNGFEDLNNQILQHAILQKTIRVGKRLRLYGINSRPLLKVLEYSTDLDIPGVTNNPHGVKKLLEDLGIEYEWKGRLKKYYQLRYNERQWLTDKIVELKGGEEGIIVPSYSLTDMPKRELRDLREYATIINACGRLGEFRVGIDCLLGDPSAQDKAIMNLRIYKNAIREAFIFIDKERENKNSKNMIKGEGYVIINLESRVKSSLAGILASILARNKHYNQGIVVCTLARNKDKSTKVSLRVSGDTTDKNLQELLARVVEPFDATSGGHVNAAGVVIDTKDEEEFIKRLQDEFKN